MPEINADTIRNAAQRALDNERNCRVSYLRSPEAAAEGCYAFEVFCPNGHRRHVVVFTRDAAGRLFSECQIPDDGEMCPSEIGKRLCYHVASALPLFFYMEDAHAAMTREDEAHQAGLLEIAVMLDGPLPRATRAVSRLRETVREFNTPGGKVRDVRCGGIQI